MVSWCACCSRWYIPSPPPAPSLPRLPLVHTSALYLQAWVKGPFTEKERATLRAKLEEVKTARSCSDDDIFISNKTQVLLGSAVQCSAKSSHCTHTKLLHTKEHNAVLTVRHASKVPIHSTYPDAPYYTLT
jgi:hypothetical protein